MRQKIGVVVLVLLGAAVAQLWAFDDFGVDYELSFEKSWNKKLESGIEFKLQTEEGGSQFDRVKITPYIEYNLLSWLEVGGAFRYTIDEKNRTKKSAYWRDHWQMRLHLSPEYKWQQFAFSWRLRTVWQEPGWIDPPGDLRVGAGFQSAFELRNRLQIAWKSPFWKLSPYLSTEFYTVWDDDPVDDTPRLANWAKTVGVKKKWGKRLKTDISLIWESEREEGIESEELTLLLSQGFSF